ncbi:hypothetical protein C8R44DRAFT_907701 [Mycena epipterygia]|nr:hypothetical protein C8R44DRAFT_907701 [Mycena epipterygia]
MVKLTQTISPLSDAVNFHSHHSIVTLIWPASDSGVFLPLRGSKRRESIVWRLRACRLRGRPRAAQVCLKWVVADTPIPLRLRLTVDREMQVVGSARSFYRFIPSHSIRVMDIHIILNPGAVGTPPTAQSSKTHRGTPSSVRSSPGSVVHRRSLRSSSAGASVQKSYATPLKRHSSLRQPPSGPLLRQSRTRKRIEEAPKPRTPTKRGRSSTYSSSAGSSTASASLANILLTRAKQHVALEAVTLGRRTRSVMDVVMDLKGPAVEFTEDALQSIQEWSQDASFLRRDYVFTDSEGLEAYWADQAAIWDGARGSSEDAVTRFPVSMERSTAAWECPDS